MTTPLSWLRIEIYQRMLDKLQPIRLQPDAILLEPDFPSLTLNKFAKRFPGARIDTIADSSLPANKLMQLKIRRSLHHLLTTGRWSSQICKNVEKQYGLIVSNLQLQQLNKPEEWLEMAHQQIVEGGLLCFSYLGPDTGKELRELGFSEADHLQTLPGALDMHDIGDALVQKGYSDPVMDMEYLHLEFDSNSTCYRDACALGLLDPAVFPDRFSGTTVKKITLEIVYGHAWVLGKNLSKSDGKTAYIRPDAIKRK